MQITKRQKFLIPEYASEDFPSIKDLHRATKCLFRASVIKLINCENMVRRRVQGMFDVAIVRNTLIALFKYKPCI